MYSGKGGPGIFFLRGEIDNKNKEVQLFGIVISTVKGIKQCGVTVDWGCHLSWVGWRSS